MTPPVKICWDRLETIHDFTHLEYRLGRSHYLCEHCGSYLIVDSNQEVVLFHTPTASNARLDSCVLYDQRSQGQSLKTKLQELMEDLKVLPFEDFKFLPGLNLITSPSKTERIRLMAYLLEEFQKDPWRTACHFEWEDSWGWKSSLELVLSTCNTVISEEPLIGTRWSSLLGPLQKYQECTFLLEGDTQRSESHPIQGSAKTRIHIEKGRLEVLQNMNGVTGQSTRVIFGVNELLQLKTRWEILLDDV